MPDTVIVVSTPRSGSSWLSRILREHPDLQVYTHNTAHTQMLYLLYPARMLNPLGDDSVERSSAIDRVADGLRARVAERYFHRRATGQTIVLASPTTVEFLPLLTRVFPEAKFVHLRRNPLDVIASFRKFQRYNGSTGVASRFAMHRHRGRLAAARTAGAHVFHSLRWARLGEPGYIGTRPTGFQRAATLPPAEFLCWYYFRLEEQIWTALSTIPRARQFEITYEALVSGCEDALAGLFEFMGVRVLDEHLAAAARGVRPTADRAPSSNGLTDDETEWIERFIAARRPSPGERAPLERAGYAR
jgi:hypothetical protein